MHSKLYLKNIKINHSFKNQIKQTDLIIGWLLL